MKKLTKNDIEFLAKEIIRICELQELAADMSVYYNNKCVRIKFNYKSSKWEEKEEYDICPLDYFEYAAYSHILSLSTEGELYDRLNFGPGTFPDELEAIFEKMGIYYELGNSWNLTFYPIDEKMEVEYTDYNAKKKKDPVYLSMCNYSEAPDEIFAIMQEWYNRSREIGDVGCCVIGEGMEFNYKGIPYRMAGCSPYQGEGSWVPNVEWVKNELAKLGATNISWHAGMMD